MPGVRAIYHRGNMQKIFRAVKGPGFQGVMDERRPPFEDDVVRYYGQYVAIVLAETFENAKAAADAVEVSYSGNNPDVDLKLTTDKPEVESHRGDAEKAFGEAAMNDAKPQSENRFKIELSRRCVAHALTLAAGAQV